MPSNFLSDLVLSLAGPQAGTGSIYRLRSNQLNGRHRHFESRFVVPAGGVQIGDRIIWGKLPIAARVVGHLSKLYWSAGAASSTVTLGDNFSAVLGVNYPDRSTTTILAG